MIRGHKTYIVTAVVLTTLITLFGCSKKEPPPASPPPAEPAAEAAKPAQTETAEATGQPQAMPGFDSKVFLATLDKNGDSKITREEYGAIWKDQAVAERNFKMIDRNGDGVLSGDEFVPKGAMK